ncbi:hypothetical protein COCNU_scaffold006799G000030 [Cocos nucifera]|nr:hypothetical protein [Cocos nucifera]
MGVALLANSFLVLAEVLEDRSSRWVAEIIFRSSWGWSPFSGEIEMLFRIQHLPRVIARFEECCSVVRARARATSSSMARCAADGNELMRFRYASSSASTGGDKVYNAAA